MAERQVPWTVGDCCAALKSVVGPTEIISPVFYLELLQIYSLMLTALCIVLSLFVEFGPIFMSSYNTFFAAILH